jgi:NAD(P)-dependent dehydrogenase (short-subunit alcohol dehydrogenase family)
MMETVAAMNPFELTGRVAIVTGGNGGIGLGMARGLTLGRELIAALRREIEAAVPEPAKQKAMLQPYQFLELHPELNRIPTGQTEWPLRALVNKIDEHVRPFLDTYRDIDVIGQFYGEFLRYTGGDKKGLGIVLTTAASH